MSVLSDDTDFLLLIPPDFFLISSDSDEEPPKRSTSESLIVSDLITHVNDLEGRICQIEYQCFNESVMTGNLHQMRQYGSADALNCTSRSYLNSRSLHATPVKSTRQCTSLSRFDDQSPRKRGSFPLEMRENILTSNNYVTQKDRDEQLLREIDHFFKNRKGSQDDDGSDIEKSVATLPKSEGVQLSTAVFNLNKVNDLLKKLDDTQREIEEKVRLKEISEIEQEDALNVEFTEKEFEGNNKVPPDKTFSEQLKNTKRVLSFDEEKRKEDGNENNPTISSGEFHCGEDSHGSLCANSRTKQAEESDAKPGKSQEFSNLISLSTLWGSNANLQKTNSHDEDDQILKQRVQEERCRRQHCEELIQKLQLRLLEEQQKVAVAIKVDHEKDQAISKLTEGWNKLVGHWRELENQRNNLAKKLLADREKFKTEMSATFQTVRRYEIELSKALDLAHGYKEKCETSEKEKKAFRANLTKEVENLKIELRDATEKLKTEEDKNEKLEKLLTTKEELINQSKAKISELQNQMREGRKTLKELQIELENAKSDKEKVCEKLKEERNRVATAEQSRKALQHQNEELKRKEKALKDDMKLLTEQMEKVKVELKEFYQEQVENIVQEKLKEFQEQLASAEKTLQGEIEMREKTVTEMAVTQVQQIVEKHLLEISVLEEKHKEECELWKLQMKQKEEKIKDLQKKLEQYSSSKTVIAQKLHSVMEAQWQQALKIINSSSPQQVKSPPNSTRADSEQPLTRQNTFTVASSGWGDASTSKSPTSIDSSNGPFCRDGLVTFREEQKSAEGMTYRVDETPQKITSDHLKKYIKALLERAPGHPTDDSLESTAYKCLEPFAAESSLARWQHVLSEPSSQLTSDVSKFSESLKPSKETKPPWK